MRTQVLTLSLLTGLSMASFSAFAEPPVQAGETLESLSKVKVSTTVNGQPGSLNELLASGQIKLVNDQNPVAADATVEAPAHANAPQAAVADAQGQQVTEPLAVQPEDDRQAVQPAEATN